MLRTVGTSSRRRAPAGAAASPRRARGAWQSPPTSETQTQIYKPHSDRARYYRLPALRGYKMKVLRSLLRALVRAASHAKQGILYNFASAEVGRACPTAPRTRRRLDRYTGLSVAPILTHRGCHVKTRATSGQDLQSCSYAAAMVIGGAAPPRSARLRPAASSFCGRLRAPVARSSSRKRSPPCAVSGGAPLPLSRRAQG